MRARLGPWGCEAGERGHLHPALGTRGFPGARPAHVHPHLPRVSVSPSEQWVVTAPSGPWQAAQCTIPGGPGTRVGAGQGWQPELRAGGQLSNKSSECFNKWKVLEIAEEKTSPWAHQAWLGRPRGGAAALGSPDSQEKRGAQMAADRTGAWPLPLSQATLWTLAFFGTESLRPASSDPGRSQLEPGVGLVQPFPPGPCSGSLG